MKNILFFLFLIGFVPSFAIGQGCYSVAKENMTINYVQSFDNNVVEVEVITSNAPCFVLRYPVYASKTSFLKKQAYNEELSDKQREKYMKLLNSTIDDNYDYFQLISSAFNEYFNFDELYFLPDSTFKSFQAGKDVSLISKNLTEVKSQNICNDYMLFITGDDRDRFYLVDKNQIVLSEPFPYKKNTFLAVFKKLLNRQSFIENQVKYFSEKLEEIYNH